MDTTDIKIINLLQENCRMSNKEIGQLVGLTSPAVAARIAHLTDSGIISGFHAEIDETKLKEHLLTYCQINVPAGQYDAFCRFCQQNPSIVEHHHILGLNNALIKIRVRDSAQLETLLKEIQKFGLSNTSLLLTTYFSRKEFPQQEFPET